MPTIAAINGAALGGGLEMALACDVRVCVDDAVLGLPELTHSLVPGGGATQRLPALVGMAQAFELLFLKHRLTGAEAARIGLVNRSVKRSDLQSEVAAMTAAISSLSPVPARMAKSLLRASQSVPLAAGLKLELDALLRLLEERSSTAAHAEAEIVAD
jgi:methylglutaconyl-CoA hydratase